MLKLHELPGDAGKKQQTKRLGRGHGTGQGKTAGKGHKGKQARSGSGKGAAFEGGQMPLIRRIPKFGFSNERFQIKREAVGLSTLDKAFEDGATVDVAALHEAGLIAKQTAQVKVIVQGTLAKKLTVKLNGFSANAAKAIEAAGGTAEVVA